LASHPFGESTEIPLGLYELPRRSGDAHFYRLGHPLAERVIAQAKEHDLPVATVTFDYGGRDGNITPLESLIGQGGEMTVSLLTVESLDQAEDHLLFAARTGAGQDVEGDVAQRLFSLPAVSVEAGGGLQYGEALGEVVDGRRAAIEQGIAERNGRYFEAEAEKLDGWADDLKVALEREIKEMDRQIREARRKASQAGSLEAKLTGQKQIKALEGQRTGKRRTLFEAQDQIDQRREALIQGIEAKLTPRTHLKPLMAIRWLLR
jgi:adenine-specific DNA-methyltransferase